MTVLWFDDEEINRNTAGGKAESLHKLVVGGMNVPPGFVVTAPTYRDFIHSTGLADRIENIVSGVDVEDERNLNAISERIQSLILNTNFSREVASEILDAHAELREEFNAEFVAVRSSATAEDMADASFAGQQETLLNVPQQRLLDSVKEIWASLYTSRAISYREEQGISHSDVDMAVVVQLMVDADKSGVMFTRHPSTGDKRAVVEATWGLGEAVVSGSVSPDRFILDRDTWEIENVSINTKKTMMVRGNGGATITKQVEDEKQNERTLTDTKLSELLAVADATEELYGEPQDVEWAVWYGELYLLQSRPITTIKNLDDEPSEDEEVENSHTASEGVQSPSTTTPTENMTVQDSNDTPSEDTTVHNSRETPVEETTTHKADNTTPEETIVQNTHDTAPEDTPTHERGDTKDENDTTVHDSHETPTEDTPTHEQHDTEDENNTTVHDSHETPTEDTPTHEQHDAEDENDTTVHDSHETPTEDTLTREPHETDEESSKRKTVHETHDTTVGDTTNSSGILVDGLGASPDNATGTVRIIETLDELDRISSGDILVTEMTTPDMVPAMQRAEAIVTEQGGMTSHAAIVSRELGVPAVIGTENATSVLTDTQTVTVDGDKGVVRSEQDVSTTDTKQDPVERVRPDTPVTPMTATEVKVNVSLPQAAERAAATGADGVGLLRIEHLVLGLGKTPEKYIADHGEDAFIQELVDGIQSVAEEFYARPVRVRTLDAPTDEFQELDGGEDEPDEHNPMLGYRGTRRSLANHQVFNCQLKAFKRLYELGYDNIELMFPLINDEEDVRDIQEQIESVGIDTDERQWGVMIETPSSALQIEEIVKESVDFVSFGTNDLTQYTLAVDRNNSRVADRFNELHPAVMTLIEYVIETCREHDVDTSICGEAGSKNQMIELLVKTGVSSISVNIDAVRDVQHEAKRVEQRMLMDSLR